MPEHDLEWAVRVLNAHSHRGEEWWGGARIGGVEPVGGGANLTAFEAVAVAEKLVAVAIAAQREGNAAWHESEAAAWRAGERDATSEEIRRITNGEG